MVGQLCSYRGDNMSANPNKNTKLTIGRLADAAGVSIATVRYYQRRGLMPLPKRPQAGGFREYSDDDLMQLQLIRRAQELGFTLAEVLDLLAHVKGRDCDAILALADRKLNEMRGQVALLEKISDTLSDLIAGCPRGCPDACPFILKLCAGETGKP
jgi:MerR family mercuric resistance operon transcriptional regulator